MAKFYIKNVNIKLKYNNWRTMEKKRTYCTVLLRTVQAVHLQTHMVPGGLGSQISRQSAHKCGKVVSPTHRPPLPSENIPGTISVIG